jgi:hypothetical protein
MIFLSLYTTPVIAYVYDVRVSHIDFLLIDESGSVTHAMNNSSTETGPWAEIEKVDCNIDSYFYFITT